MIQVYTGNGKGKTTAAIGLAVRALGQNKKVCIIQFLKPSSSGELRILKKLKYVSIYCFGRKGFCKKENLCAKDYSLAGKCLERAKSMVKRMRPGILILDELNMALHLGLLDKNEVIDFIRKVPKKVEVVITGRYAPKEIIKLADLVSEIKEVKHYYSKGIRSRKGIEY